MYIICVKDDEANSMVPKCIVLIFLAVFDNVSD